MSEEVSLDEFDPVSPIAPDESGSEDAAEPAPPPVRFRRRRLILWGVLVMTTATLLLWSASQWVPKFYRQTLAIPPKQSAQSGREFEEQVFTLHDYLANPESAHGQWKATFTAAQINGWLAVELPIKFPKLLPEGVTDPRVKIESNKVTIACKCDHGELSAVISLEFDAYLTEQPNVIAVRIRDGRIGAVPGMRKLAIDQIQYAAWRSRIPISWAQKDGDPVLLVPVPPFLYEQFGDLQVKQLFLEEGAVDLAGEITPIPEGPKVEGSE